MEVLKILQTYVRYEQQKVHYLQTSAVRIQSYMIISEASGKIYSINRCAFQLIKNTLKELVQSHAE